MWTLLLEFHPSSLEDLDHGGTVMGRLQFQLYSTSLCPESVVSKKIVYMRDETWPSEGR
jgi:hypothetical protein